MNRSSECEFGRVEQNATYQRGLNHTLLWPTTRRCLLTNDEALAGWRSSLHPACMYVVPIAGQKKVWWAAFGGASIILTRCAARICSEDLTWSFRQPSNHIRLYELNEHSVPNLVDKQHCINRTLGCNIDDAGRILGRQDATPNTLL